MYVGPDGSLPNILGTCFFAVFIVVFVFTRLMIFPLMIIPSAHWESMQIRAWLMPHAHLASPWTCTMPRRGTYTPAPHARMHTHTHPQTRDC